MLSGSAIGGRTARACDGCMLRKARWFCCSDDAFLCDACDASVHSANQLASRHERVRTSTASRPASIAVGVPDWHQKVTRRARTPRNGVKGKAEVKEGTSSLIVPEIGAEEDLSCENEDLMVFQVPVLDADCSFWNEDESASVEELHSLLDFVSDDIQFSGGDEGLIGKAGVDFMCDDAELEMLDFNEKSSRVKMEEGDDAIDAVLACQFDAELIDSESRESLLDWDFGFECDEVAIKDEEQVVEMKTEGSTGGEETGFGKRMLLLKLNCENVVSAWDDHGCPWMNGTRPELDPLGHGWPQLSVPNSAHGRREGENGGRSVGGGSVVSEERLARVTRYREKRRSRLFSKKIRYQVRKLNAEKRPRMKGRFCKRVQSYVGPQVLV